MSRKIGNAQSRATFIFHHSEVLSLPAVLLRKLSIIEKPLYGELNYKIYKILT